METIEKCPPNCYYPKQTIAGRAERYKETRRSWRPLSETKIAKSYHFSYKSSPQKEIIIDLLDGQTISLSYELKAIADEIEFSKAILTLKEGWDDEKSVPINKEVWLTAIKYLAANAEYIKENYAKIILPPDINPGPDGSIDFSWRTEGARALMNIREKNSDIKAYYFLELHGEEKGMIKGDVSIKTSTTILAEWMKNLM